MSIISKITQGIVQLVPDKKTDRLIQEKKYVGQPISRVDGRLKVTGEATFTAEYQLENIAYAALHYSSIAKGKIKSFHLEEAKKAAGVISIITYENAPKLKKPLTFSPGGQSRGSAASDIPILHDENVYWNGQPIAIVVAETQEDAEQAATLIKVHYEEGDAKTSFDKEKAGAKSPGKVMNEDAELKIGDAEDELKAAAYAVDELYETPKYNHNPIEPHATIAAFLEDDRLVVYDATQHLYGVKNTIADLFSIKPDNVKAVSPFVGGGFGSKGSLWMNTMLCVLAAKQTDRPVKLALSRAGVFRIVGGRTPSEQRVAIGADETGKFTAIIHSGVTATTDHNNFPEQFTFPVRYLYDAKSFYISQKVCYLDMVANTFMRAPGESIGTFALESAVDELAHKIGKDPIELRILNEPEKNPVKGTEFSSRHLVEAYRKGADKWGWKYGETKSRKEGEWLIGQGVATAYYPYYRFPAGAKIALFSDGTAVIKAAAHEMGMGTVTVQLQHAADRLGLDMDNVSFQYGDSTLPKSAFAGGSNQTASVAAGIMATAEKLLKAIFKEASDNKAFPLRDLKYEEVEPRDGGLYSKADNTKGMSYADIFKLIGKSFWEEEATSDMPLELLKYSMGSYGAQFCELKVNEVTGEIRIIRWLGSFDTGRVINPKTASSQFRGGIIMGIGMALMEETFFDERNGRIMNPSLAEYHIPVNADVPHIDIIYNDIPDEHSPLGGHGIGEIGITGVAAAIANAICNATGKRIRSLPITLDKVVS